MKGVRTSLVLLLLAAVLRAQEAATGVRVRVLGFDGRPVASARLDVRRQAACGVARTIEARWRATPAGAEDTVVATAVTDADGWALFDALRDGAFDITARAPGHAVRGAQILWPPVGGSPPPTILLDPGHAVSGRVMAKDGVAVPGALVAATFPSAGTARWDRLERSLLARTDKDGDFRIEGVPAGTVSIDACLPGTWFANDPLVHVPDGAPIEIVLAVHVFDGVVKDARTGAPVPGAPVFLSTESTLAHATTDVAGTLRVLLPEPAPCRGETAAPGYLRSLVPVPGKPLEFRAVPAVPIRGIVRDAAGPVAFAVVTATWLDGLSTGSVSASTGPGGEFDVRVREGLVHLRAQRRGEEGQEDPEIDVRLATRTEGGEGLFMDVPPEGCAAIGIDISALTGIGRIVGRVVSIDGAPVPARVSAHERAAGFGGGMRTETAADGTFVIDGLPAGKYEIDAWPDPDSSSGPAGIEVEVEPGSAGARADIVVPQEPLPRIAGRVLGLDAHAGAYAEDGSTGRRYPVAPDGRFTFPAGACDGCMEVEIATPDGWTAYARRRWSGAVNVGDLALRAPRTFLVVAEETGAPIAGATATLCTVADRRLDDWIGPAWRADGEGRISIPIADDVGMRIQLRAPGFSGRNLVVSKVGERVVLKPLAAIAGRVRYGAGGWAAGVRIRAKSQAPDAPSDDRATVTDADGRYRIEGLEAVPHYITVESVADGPSVYRQPLSDVAVPNESLDLVIATVRTIEGRVVDVLGRPVADAMLRAGGEETRTDASGAFRIQGLFAGKYDFKVEREGLSVDASPRKVPTGTKDAVLRAEFGLRLTGRVVDEDGAPRAGWLVTARRAWVGSVFGSAPSRAPDRCARTDVEGRFVIEDLAAGPWDIALGLEARAPESGGRAVAAGSEDIVVVLPRQ